MTSPGEERALRFVAMMLLLQRVSYLVPAVADAARTAAIYRSAMVNVAMVVAAVAWNVGLALVVQRRGWFPRWSARRCGRGGSCRYCWRRCRFISVLRPYGSARCCCAQAPNGILGVLDSYFWFTLIAYVMRRYLCRQGRALDEVTRRQLDLEARRAAERARYDERIAQFRRRTTPCSPR